MNQLRELVDEQAWVDNTANYAVEQHGALVKVIN